MGKWQLPDGWEWKSLGNPEICDVIMGQSPPGNTYNDTGDGLPFFQGKADFGKVYPTTRKWCTRPTKISLPGDVLISVRAPVGPTNLTQEKCIIGRGLAALRPSSNIITKYLLYVIRVLRAKIVSMGSGSTFASISKSTLKALEIPIPYPNDPKRSLAEQRRIVARLEALLGEVREMRALTEAMEKDIGRVMESAIQEVFDRPNRNWETSPLTDVAFIQTGTAKGRRFGNRKTVELPYLRVANVQAGYLDLEKIKTITIATDEIDRYRLQPGDLLLTEGGDYDKLGRGALWDGQIDPCVHQNHIFAVRFDQDIVLPKFAEYEMQSWYAKHYFLSVAKKTTNLATINKTKLGNFPIRYPSLAEQQIIVERLNSIKTEVADMRKSQRGDGTLVEQLEQSILAAAFRGEL